MDVSALHIAHVMFKYSHGILHCCMHDVVSSRGIVTLAVTVGVNWPCSQSTELPDVLPAAFSMLKQMATLHAVAWVRKQLAKHDVSS